MRNKILTLILFVFIGAGASAQETSVSKENKNGADMKFDKETFDFGTLKQGESVTHEFKFKNNGKEPLIITQAQGSCGCTVPEYPKEPVKQGQTGTIKVTFNSAGKTGAQDKTVTITSNAKNSPVVLHVKGNIEKAAE